MADPVVEVERLRRVFAGRPRRSEPVVALDGLSLTVAAGEAVLRRVADRARRIGSVGLA